MFNLIQDSVSKILAFWWFYLSTSQVPSLQLECLTNFIAELSLLEYSMLCYPPSLIAASATFLARFILFPSKKPWVCFSSQCSKPHVPAFRESFVWFDGLLFLCFATEFHIAALRTIPAFWFVCLCERSPSPLLQQ